jgi:tetratricopeptide (TPR) repeat protein
MQYLPADQDQLVCLHEAEPFDLGAPVHRVCCHHRSTGHKDLMEDSRPSTNPQDRSGAAGDPPFMKKFEELIGSWAEATSEGKTEEAYAAAMQALIMAGEDALRNPTPELLLKQEADDLEHMGNWAEAEAVRRKVLSLEETSGNFGLIAKAQMDLCRVLRVVGRGEEASQFASAATASARRADIFPVLVMALECEAWCALDRGDSPKALAAASEAMQVFEPGKLFDQMRAKALTNRARCLLANNDSAGAETDLAASWELLQAHAGSRVMPGPILTLANWWEVKSQLEERQGKLESAREAIARAVEYRRRGESPYALFTLARALQKLGEISRAAGDLAGGDQAFNEAKSIRQRLYVPSGR